MYTLLFLVPGCFASLLIAAVVAAAFYGALWLYVFGDEAWPAWTGQAVSGVMVLVFCCLWISTAVAGYVVGRRLESVPGFQNRHVWLAVGATLLPIAAMVFHQLSVGNLGPKSDSQLCSEHCTKLGFSASSVPPRNSGDRSCRCLGERGEPVDSVAKDELLQEP